MLGYRRLSCVLAILVMPALAWADTNTGLYKSYQRLLTDYVVEQAMPGNGLISAFDYRSALADSGLQKNLADQQAKLQEFDPATLNGQEESVAFWINAYNFFMLAQILTERPDGELVSSVWDYGGRVNPFVDNVFERKSFAIGGREYSLNEIEKDILLGDDYADMGWKDARVHFAVNCASVGCPPLRDTLYTADNLEDMLAENTRRAFSTERHLRVEGEVLYLTELFKWYAEDFTEVSGSEKAFIEEWADPIVVDRVAGTGSIEFIDYDWTLNSPANFSELR
ncbi:DUF547 domain-containing protein [Marinobacter salexigens]|uniref:DUF547 domain-containing protein n=1 Tax=Marinobacter salexigens TaxID=1925763 RepID=A0ABS6A6H9_9GAMM|nr:DUF547 domain-containing protein [Marinobacter salexigens]MBU2872782.1 DUF547 domain-containing protein [Marinobacter salexigens]